MPEGPKPEMVWTGGQHMRAAGLCGGASELGDEMKRIYAIGLALLLAPAGAADTAHATEAGKIKLSFASTFPGGMKLIGAAAPRLAERIARATEHAYIK